MAILTQSSRYKEYIQRINEYRAITNKDKKYSDIQVRTEKLLTEIKSRNDKEVYYHLFLGICSAALILGFMTLFYGNFILGIILILLAIIASLVYRTSLIHEIKAQINLNNSKHLSIRDKVASHVQYLLQGIHIKVTRIRVVRAIYMVIFPLLMFTSLMMFQKSIQVNHIALGLVAYLLGSGFWYFYYKTELDELVYQQRELEEYQANIFYQSETANHMKVYEEEE